MAKPKKTKIRMLTVTLAKEGKRIPQPSTGRRMEYGEEYEVPDAPFWRRRVRDGDVKLLKGPDMPKGTPVIHDKAVSTDKKKEESDKKKKDDSKDKSK